jgi:hypothetical protein
MSESKHDYIWDRREVFQVDRDTGERRAIGRDLVAGEARDGDACVGPYKLYTQDAELARDLALYMQEFVRDRSEHDEYDHLPMHPGARVSDAAKPTGIKGVTGRELRENAIVDMQIGPEWMRGMYIVVRNEISGYFEGKGLFKGTTISAELLSEGNVIGNWDDPDVRARVMSYGEEQNNNE